MAIRKAGPDPVPGKPEKTNGSKWVQHKSGSGEKYCVTMETKERYYAETLDKELHFELPITEYVEVEAPPPLDLWDEITNLCVIDETNPDRPVIDLGVGTKPYVLHMAKGSRLKYRLRFVRVTPEEFLKANTPNNECLAIFVERKKL